MSKTQTEKAQVVDQKKNTIKKYLETINNLEELRAKLTAWSGKFIDKRFFEANFLVSNEYRSWTRFSIRKPAYSWSHYLYEIRISQDCNLELQDRTKEHILDRITIEIANRFDWIAEYREALTKLKTFNEADLVKDLRALYVKHGRPEVWGKVLESYTVKYPDNQ